MRTIKILSALAGSGKMSEILDLLGVDDKQVYQEKVENSIEKTRDYFRKKYWDNPEKSRASSQKYRDTHREEIRAYTRKYYDEHREEILERKRTSETTRKYSQLYYQKNREKIRESWQSLEFKERRRKWREANRDRINQQKRERYYKNRETILAQNKASRERAKERAKNVGI